MLFGIEIYLLFCVEIYMLFGVLILSSGRDIYLVEKYYLLEYEDY